MHKALGQRLTRQSRPEAANGVAERRLLAEVAADKLPRHVAIIMDGNGRWAMAQALPRREGHRAGVRPLRAAVEACAQLQIEYLTVYAFSTENWERPRDEVGFLMNLLMDVLDRELPELEKQGVRLRVIGDRSRLPARVNAKLDEALLRSEETEGRLVLCVALNYGGRAEIIRAARRLATDIAAGAVHPDQVDEGAFSAYLDTAGIPDPDLIIRTGGDHRISNFLLWQSAYAELWLTPVFWPDFERIHLYEAVLDYQRRQRRFGRI